MCLADQKKVNSIRSLYNQARGTHETLELMWDEKGINVPDETMAGLMKREDDYKSRVAKLRVTKVTETELVVPLVFDVVSLDAQAYIDPYGSNDVLIAKEDVLAMKTISSRLPSDLAGSSDAFAVCVFFVFWDYLCSL